MSALHQPLPKLLFLDQQAQLQTRFQALADQFSHVLPHGEFDSSAQQHFIYKGNVFVLNGLAINHAINSHLLASAGFQQPGLSLILAGQSSVLAREDKTRLPHYAALLSPPGLDLRFETSQQQITSSLHITFQLDRLHQISQIMQGGEGKPLPPMQLRQVQLNYGSIACH